MKKNLRRIGFTATALLAVMLIAGCAKFKDYGVYDKTVPADQLCTMEIQVGLYVRELDGKKVGSFYLLAPKASGWGLISNNAEAYSVVKIPAGNHTLLANYVWGEYSTSYEVKGLNITYDFIAGHTYRLAPIFFNKDGDVVDRISSASTLKLSLIDKGRIDKALDDAFGK